MRSGRPRPFTAAEQYAALQGARLPAARGRLGMGRFTWEFEARPTPLSRTYTIQILYRQGGGAPDVLIAAPDLGPLTGGRRLPHVYSQRPPRLCLYVPGSGEWHPAKRIAETFVPWATLWLFYFEDWLLTDEWAGGGEHPKMEDEGGEGSRGRRLRG